MTVTSVTIQHARVVRKAGTLGNSHDLRPELPDDPVETAGQMVRLALAAAGLEPDGLSVSG